MKTPILPLLITSIMLCGCDQEGPKLRADNQALRQRIADLESELARRPRDLDRQSAAEILQKHFSTPSISKLSFSPKGYERAKQEGFFEEGQWPKFTRKGREVFGDLLGGDARYLPGLPGFSLSKPIAERVISIDGIADGGFGAQGMKEVEFVTEYDFPANTQSIATSYIYSGRKATILFRRFDDGWRVQD